MGSAWDDRRPAKFPAVTPEGSGGRGSVRRAALGGTRAAVIDPRDVTEAGGPIPGPVHNSSHEGCTAGPGHGPTGEEHDMSLTLDRACPLRATHPLHNCSDRDGNPITGDKVCWALARRQATMTRWIAGVSDNYARESQVAIFDSHDDALAYARGLGRNWFVRRSDTQPRRSGPVWTGD